MEADCVLRLITTENTEKMDLSNIYCTCKIEGQTMINVVNWTLPNFINILDHNVRPEFRHVIPDMETAPLLCYCKKPKTTPPLRDTAIGPNYFQLKLRFMGHKNDAIKIYYLLTQPLYMKLILKLCLKNCGECTVAVKEYNTIYAKKWIYVATLLKFDIINHADSFLLGDKSLSLKFQFMITDGFKSDCSSICGTQLSRDYKQLYINGPLSDVTMKSVEGVEYKVHKVVLSSRSPVLKAHFEHNTRECFTNVIETPFESDILNEILIFLYKGRSLRIFEIPNKLLQVADYYQVKRLKNMCEQALYKKLTVDNTIETLELALLYNANMLKDFTLEFIKYGQAGKIILTQSWAQAKSAEMIKIIYEHLVKDTKPVIEFTYDGLHYP